MQMRIKKKQKQNKKPVIWRTICCLVITCFATKRWTAAILGGKVHPFARTSSSAHTDESRISSMMCRGNNYMPKQAKHATGAKGQQESKEREKVNARRDICNGSSSKNMLLKNIKREKNANRSLLLDESRTHHSQPTPTACVEPVTFAHLGPR
jgi:hypothetical protein